ncbi:malate:quinone oxidoreductase [Flavihumibacter petaseus]|uniref:Probable malate:quinone oxidoreductase n=1 Tax=Flavihumibacter petaseus NBRC 106054 TaxID=1220578 RepID=A0A0E9MU54_9BACT|nr:malate:quinone oxidoreductase [Flavihumibacter petaseus]GAO41099.1 putative malate--quinone oxidoreductase [Flavihumibacter petaseus NBRC 106054]
MEKQPVLHADIVLIGAGIMSATLAALLKQLNPDFSIVVLERLDVLAGESSDAWNNAGTGHSALCELNYTPEKADGSIDIKKAIKIFESFEESKQFWSYLIQAGVISQPDNFIRPVPHISFVRGEKDVNYLRKRYDAMKQYHLFDEMEFTTDRQKMAGWMPLIMEGRDENEPVAATRVENGTDVNFGALSRKIFEYLWRLPDVRIRLAHEVEDLKQQPSGKWLIEAKNLTTRNKTHILTRFVFIGAGGGSLPLLEKSGIPEGRGYGGFPVSGQWLRCINPAVIEKHQAKVYGKAAVGAPPMSVPHLDTRVIDGKKALLFGPYAGFSTRFLKNGSLMDLPASIKYYNILPMIKSGLDNIDLTKYLISQVTQSADDRLDALQEYMPLAKMADWKLEIAGQRVQVIKKDPVHGGVLEFGTEIVCAGDGSIAALLGASPGASTAVSIMLELLEKCFPAELATPGWQEKLRNMIPSYKQSLLQNDALYREVSEKSNAVLQLENKVTAQG